MKAYITNWLGGNRTIGTQNLGGSVEIEIDESEYNLLLISQHVASSLQKDLHELSRSQS